MLEREIPRRDFIRYYLVGAGALALTSCMRRKELPQPQVTIEHLGDTPEGYLKLLRDATGVEIPNKPSNEFDRWRMKPVSGTTDQWMLQNEQYRVPSLEVSKVLAEGILTVPNASFLADLVIPYFVKRDRPGGAYLGLNWPYYLDFMDDPTFDKTELERRFFSQRSGLMLEIPEGTAMDAALPKVADGAEMLTRYQTDWLNKLGVNVPMVTEFPWTTQKERLKQVVVHELLHGFVDKLSLAIANNDPSLYFQSLVYSPVLLTPYFNNPIFEYFGKVNGWIKEPYFDYLATYDKDYLETVKKEQPELGNIYVWDRDPNVWGDIQHRKTRLTTYASYGPINETFCEFWTAYLLYPNLLTLEETRLFGPLTEGLKNNPNGLIDKLLKGRDLYQVAISKSAGFASRPHVVRTPIGLNC
jgi:hypothetical protein